jgi:hypothetical protein
MALRAYRWKKLLVSGDRLTPPAAKAEQQCRGV